VTTPDLPDGPPSGVIPVAVPGDAALISQSGLAAWAGAVTVFRTGFEFTLLITFDADHREPPADFALDVPERARMTWLEMAYADGRRRAADLNANTPFNQPGGPQLTVLSGESDAVDGRGATRWWVTPLPPPGPVEIKIHLNGTGSRIGSGQLDGSAIAAAAARAQVLWEVPPTGRRD
jgi:hypothetical protein